MGIEDWNLCSVPFAVVDVEHIGLEPDETQYEAKVIEIAVVHAALFDTDSPPMAK